MVYAVDSTLSTLSANQKSVLSLVNSTYTSAPSINGQATMFVSWYLDVHVTDSIGQNVSSANVTAYLEGVMIRSELTDANGLARAQRLSLRLLRQDYTASKPREIGEQVSSGGKVNARSI